MQHEALRGTTKNHPIFIGWFLKKVVLDCSIFSILSVCVVAACDKYDKEKYPEPP
jgi:hypothetical protein